MEYNLTPEQWSEIKRHFSSWQELQTRKKELAEENKEICKAAAAVFDGKQTDASKLFKNLAQKWDGQEAEAEIIATMIEMMEANSR